MLVGQSLGPFYVDKELGHGAMGAVYRAVDQETQKRLAIKVIGPALASNPTVLARFEREANILKKLKHPNIVRLYGTGRYHKTPFFVMEFIEGETLQTALERRGRFTWEEVVELGKQVCSALQHAHHQGIIHRDLKPSNIMLTPDGTAKLTDFGIAKGWEGTQLTATNSTVGTAAYMSPEQCRGEKSLTHKSDLYSLGVVFYELLTGRRPFEAESAMDMFLAHTKGSFERPARLILDIPIWLDTLVCQLLEKKPEHRPFDAVMVASALDQVQERVAAKKSAGVEVVVAPAAKVATRLRQVDESDQEAARLLRAAAGKKVGRRRVKRFYEKAWFQGAGILILLSAIVGLVYLVARPADPHQLFLNAQALMETNDLDQQLRARDGPIKKFLSHYGDRQDEEAQRIFAWADQVDLSLREHQLQNRLKFKLAAEDEDERSAFAAVKNEEGGDLTKAREHWEKLLPRVDDEDRGQRAWGLLAKKRIQALDDVQTRDQELRGKLDDARAKGQEVQAASEKEKQAARALHFEVFGDVAKALEHWKALRYASESESDQRVWFLMAVKKVNELTKKEKENVTSVKLVHRRLGEAEALQEKQPTEAIIIYRDIVFLYGDNSEMTDDVQEAKKQLETLGSK